MSYAEELVAEVADYFYQSSFDGRYYLREGYDSLPQGLIQQLRDLTDVTRMTRKYLVALIGPDGNVTWSKFFTIKTAEEEAIKLTTDNNFRAEVYYDNGKGVLDFTLMTIVKEGKVQWSS